MCRMENPRIEYIIFANDYTLHKIKYQILTIKLIDILYRSILPLSKTEPDELCKMSVLS